MSLDEVVENEVQLSPGSGQWAALGEIGRDQGIQQSQTGCQNPAVGFGEQHGDTPTEWGQVVAL